MHKTYSPKGLVHSIIYAVVLLGLLSCDLGSTYFKGKQKKKIQRPLRSNADLKSKRD